MADEAYAVALSVFYAPPLAATSVCFLEMLGLPSLKLRVDAKAANVILSFMSRREEPQHHSIRQSLGNASKYGPSLRIWFSLGVPGLVFYRKAVRKKSVSMGLSEW